MQPNIVLQSVRGNRPPSHIVAGLSIAAFLLFAIGSSFTIAQEKKPGAPNAGGNATNARGKYIVTEVAKCGNCHTPRTQGGQLDNGRWLAGGPVPYLPAQPQNDWPLICPRIGGLPPASDAQIITLLTTGVWITGKPLRPPMPEFHMTRADAEAVLAYLKSITVRGGSQ